MYIIAIAWTFVVLLMAAAEAMETSVVGGVLTFILYCALPLGLFLYIFGTPQRRRNKTNADKAVLTQHLEAAQTAEHLTTESDLGSRPAGADERAEGADPTQR